MLPISEAIFAKKFHRSNSDIDWILFDVYKIAPDYPLEVSVYGYTFDVSTMPFHGDRIEITEKFRSKSARDNLKGLTLTCGLVVCIEYCKLFYSIPKM